MNRSLEKIGVVGAGAMGAGIGQIAAQAGCLVTITDVSPEALAKGQASVQAALQAMQAKGKLAEGGADAVLARIRWSGDLDDLSATDLLIEAVIERAEIKRDVFTRLQAIAPGAILASNTSSLSITALAQGLAAPERFCGFHFFNPAPVMKLVEVVPGAATAPPTAALLVETAKAWGKHPVLVRDVPGFIVNRLARPFYGEGWRALEEGVGPPEAIDAALRLGGGFRMGPLELGDLIGHDVNYSVACSIYEAYFGRTRFVPALGQARLVADGRLGRKTKQGVYGPQGAPEIAYVQTHAKIAAIACFESDGRSAAALAKAHQAPVLVRDWAQPNCPIWIGGACERGLESAPARTEGDGPALPRLMLKDRPGGLVLRTWLQLANAAADGLRDGIASPADIDAAMVFGLNYPVGPLAWADAYGVARAVQALEAIAAETGESLYQPSEILRRTAFTGARLSGDAHA